MILSSPDLFLCVLIKRNILGVRRGISNYPLLQAKDFRLHRSQLYFGELERLLPQVEGGESLVSGRRHPVVQNIGPHLCYPDSLICLVLMKFRFTWVTIVPAKSGARRHFQVSTRHQSVHCRNKRNIKSNKKVKLLLA